ncbi:uncharacterized protein [Arachis hypogaea]|uniref:uncharacterized protein n=1 Tax=Arachis hypogaea TaxID=3818 RepID=UPI000DEC6474|nr:uncharacterized protein LOC112749002 [Arachis hypogaea]
MQGVWKRLHVDDSHHTSVAADSTVTIKVLQETTEAIYGFRPSYRNVWIIKQKAVAQIYGDWEESYVELPRWILGVQGTMDRTVALLKTSPYGETSLLAIAQDGNSNILLVAFAHVEWENTELRIATTTFYEPDSHSCHQTTEWIAAS